MTPMARLTACREQQRAWEEVLTLIHHRQRVTVELDSLRTRRLIFLDKTQIDRDKRLKLAQTPRRNEPWRFDMSI